jgi:hypothetical protein
MKVVGKIGDTKTVLEENCINGEILFSYSKKKFNTKKNLRFLDKYRIQSKQGFASIRTNNCVFKGKWVYEIQIITNNLQQIGWCQLNTPFTNTEGVGDDLTSYAYDGYRIVLWHAGKKDYGIIWDVGDVIGCCIDLDNKKLEYFLNGISLGIATEDIPIGENIAYFPAISFSQEEKAIYNFGQSPFKFSYSGYEPFDIPVSIFDGSVEITAELLDIMKNSLLKILMSQDSNVTPYHKISISNKLFNFLIQISFKDIFIFKTLLIPFLYDIASKHPKELKTFFEHIFIYMNYNKEKVNFVIFLFDNLCGMIEENAIIGEKGIEEWNNLITLFLELLKIDFIVELWIETSKTIENLKCIFNTNYLKMRDVYDFLKTKYENFTNDITAYKAFKDIRSEFYEKNLKTNENLENLYSEGVMKILVMFLTDDRSFKIRQISNDNERTNLKTLLIDYVNKGNDFFGVGNALIEALGSSNNKKDHTAFYKNFIFNLYSILSEYMNQDFKNFSTDLWFKRLNSKNLFYDEVGIGGTINHVTTEYINFIEDSFKQEINTFQSEVNHRIVKITNVLMVHLRETTRILEKYKNVPLKQVLNFENGSDYFDKLFRNYFYLYTERNQTLLYKYAYFLIKWINTLLRKNRYIIYFMPKSVFDIPFDIFRFLNKIKAKILYNSEFRKEVNLSSPHFKNDDFTFEIVYFYTYLFGDQTIANPDIKESLILKIKYFMKKKEISKIYEENIEVIEYLIKGLLNYMSIESLCHVSCEIMVKIIKPMSFGNSTGILERVRLVEVTQKFFENNLKTFHEFMDNYTKLINKVMTEYTITLNESSNKILSGNSSNMMIDIIDTKTTLLKKLTFVYSLLCDLMKIFEFLLTAYPYEFFDTTTLNYSRFVNFLKNTSSRILEKTYINQLMQLLAMTKQANNFPGGKDAINLMAYSIIGIFLNIEYNKQTPKFQNFVNKLANLGDLDFHPYLNLFNLLEEMNIDPQLKSGVEKYKNIVEFFIENMEKKRERTMSVRKGIILKFLFLSIKNKLD